MPNGQPSDPIADLAPRLLGPGRAPFLAERGDDICRAYGPGFLADLSQAVITGDAAAAKRVSDVLAPGVRLSVLATGEALSVGYETDGNINGTLDFPHSAAVTQAVARVAVAVQVHIRERQMEEAMSFCQPSGPAFG
jgi:hypothetical protein